MSCETSAVMQLMPRRLWIAWLTILAILNGCVAMQPFPHAARAGDTVTLAVGSADGMTAGNTLVEFFPGNDPATVSPILVPVRSIVKVYPDKSSNAWLGVTGIAPRSGHGNWLNVVVVDLPDLPVGSGIIRVTTDGEVTYPRFSASPNGTDIPMEILPGNGSANPFDYYSLDGVSEPGDLWRLEQLPQVVIKPPVAAEGDAESVHYGAIMFNITVPMTSLDGSPVMDEGIAVILDDQPQNLTKQVNLFWRRDGNDFTISLISPLGMASYQSRVSIVPKFPDFPYKIIDVPVLNSVIYYDLNGSPTTGPLPITTWEN